jgi:hypothetical protein
MQKPNTINFQSVYCKEMRDYFGFILSEIGLDKLQLTNRVIKYTAWLPKGWVSRGNLHKTTNVFV